VNSLQRTNKVIQQKGEEVDRLPVDLHSFAMAAHISPYNMDEIFNDGKLMAETQLNLWQEVKHDVILLENGVTALAEALGAKVEYYPDAPPEIVEPLLPELAAVKKLAVPDVKTTASLPELLKATKKTKNTVGDKAFVMGRGDQGPFSLAAHLRGIEQFMMDLLDPDKRELLNELIAICTETVKRFACAQIEAGADATSMGDSLAGPELISPKMYREFAREAEIEVISAVQEIGGKISLHICGDCTKILTDMASTGADILEIDEKADLSQAFAATKDKCSLLGPVSPALLKNGSEAEIIATTNEVIAEAKNYNNLIIGPGCALPSDTPLDKIKLFVATAQKSSMQK